MKESFQAICKLLENPFFEINLLGKESIRERIFPIDTYKDIPANFQFINWQPEDNCSEIAYSFQHTRIGWLLFGSTPKGLCFAGFTPQDKAETKADLMRRFPKQPIVERITEYQKLAVEYCNGNHNQTIPLHMKGTAFQTKIWKQLVRIPQGSLSTYGSLSDNPGAAQAVGSAVGANPVAYIVPCHRIVRNNGSFQGYYWGTAIKKQLLAYELRQ